MTLFQKTLSVTAFSALMAAGILVVTAAPAAARIVCNAEGDCWHTDATPPRVPSVTFSVHPDDWYFHQTWDNNSNRHYREPQKGRGYYKGGIWIQL